jgi:hypothetical protein
VLSASLHDRPVSAALRASALDAATGHAAWLERHGPRSWDPYDFWATRAGTAAKAFYYTHPRLGVPLVAPFVGLDTLVPATRALVTRPKRYPIADAHYAMGFYLLARGPGGAAWGPRALPFLEALVEERCPGEREFCWGYPFDWATCFGVWRAGTPFITSTPYMYEAFEMAHELTGSSECLTIMESIGRFAMLRIRGVEVAPGVKASTYSPHDRRRVVNASAYRGFLLASAGVRFGVPSWVDEARASVDFVLRTQRADGSWLYAEDGRDAFVDNIHTCFVIKNLVKAQPLLESDAIARSIELGWAFFRRHLLDESGLPVPFARSQRPATYRRDLYDYAESINLALLLAPSDPDALDVADRIVASLLRDWVLPDGSFTTRLMLAGRNTIPYVRWAQSQAFRALALYATRKEA